MSNQVYFEYFCKDSILWDYNLTWNTTRPKLTRCLNQTLLNWIPSSLLWIYFFLELTRKQKPLKKSITWNFLNRIRLIVSVFCTLINIIQILNLTNQYVNFGNSPLPADFLAPLIDIGSFTLVTLSLYYHRLRGILTINSNIWIFLFLKTVTVFLTNYSTWTNWNKEYSHFEATLFSIYFAVICLLLILCSFSDQTNDKKENLKRILSPELEASFPNRLAFWWFNEMAILGWKRNLTTADLWQLNEELRTENLFPSFEEKLNQQWSKSKGKKVNIVPILVKLYGRYFLIGSCFKLIYDVCQFITPQLLKYLLNFIEDGLEKPIWHGFFIAFSMFVVTTLQGLFLNYYSYRMYIVGMKTNSVLTAAIYKKSLDLSDQSRKEVSSGEIINLMAVDSKRFLDLLPYLSLIWSAPFQIIVSIYFLYLELGYSAFFGLAVMILMLPLNALIAHWNRGLQIKLMNQKDERVKFMNEILAGIKILKFYAWEESFINRITSLRKKELEHLKQISYLNSIVKFISNCAPMMVSVTTFAVYVLLQKETLTAQKAFVSLSLFNILKFPLTMLPILISYNVMASVSVKRINSFLSNPDLEQYVTRNSESDAIVIENGSFGWGKKKEGFSFESSEEGLKTKKRKSFFQRSCKIGGETNNNENGGLNPVNEEPTLVDINLRIAQGSFVAIVGSVGSGKSSLINAILGEMKRIKGRVNVSEKLSIAYVAQEAWIQNSSLRDNILFGQPYDKNRYNKVISACALRPDISYLPGGDKTEIGEKGINLSGGQKQRVSLARACYSGSDLYIFDDPLSAVDAHVSKHIFDKVLSSKSGLLRNKTRVLVTNKLDLLSKVDKIIVLKNGKISEAGTYKELMNSGRDFADLVNHYTIQNIEKDDFEESLRDSYNRSRSESLRKDRAASLLENKLIESETSETGKVKWSVYGEYFKMVSFVWANIIVFGFLISSGFSLASNVWLSKWSEDSQSQTELNFNTTESFNDLPTESTQDSQAQTKMRLGVYSLLGLLQCFFNLFGSLALVIGTLRASFGFHRDLLHRIFRCSMAFFDTTPAGRIVNRFSKDIDTIDVLIPDSLSSWLLCFFQVLATFVIISIQTPMFLTVLFPILVLYGFIQRIYVASSRQLKRLESVTRSPIYSHFSETLNGVNTIKAFNVCQRFKHESAEKVDFNISCYYPTVIANRWLALRLDFCGNLITLFAAVFAILTRGTLSSGDVGLSVSYALSITLMFNWFVRMSSELETNIVAVERILEYCCIPSEADLYNAKLNPRETWPEDGSIKFEAYSARYRPGTELVLKSISVDIKPKEKIGIVGRTGAGKSTVTLSLFRIIEPASGSIYIDDYNISDLPLHPLRSRLAIIPQDPVLFSGTLRFNLDPFNRYTDKEIWNSLAHAHLKNFILDLNQGLEYSISEEGKNLSVGQRQLLCLARALLKRPKILFLDEATAAIDLETDSLIQTTIRSEFKDCTILTIAHRLNTIMDSDRVLVLDKGKIAEFDSPNALLAQKDTIFYSLAKEANLVT